MPQRMGIIRTLNNVRICRVTPPPLLRQSSAYSGSPQILDTYTSVIAPILPHLAEEIHQFRLGNNDSPTSVFRLGWRDVVRAGLFSYPLSLYVVDVDFRTIPCETHLLSQT
jgi:hypothetical protein